MSALDEIEARLAAATPGPWEAVTDDHKHTKEHSIWADSKGDYVAEWVATAPDAAMLAHAPTDLSALVAFARRVEEILGDHVSTNEQVFDDLDRTMKRLNGGAS
jgi:hypothetical protein